jgi:hypothetical protein
MRADEFGMMEGVRGIETSLGFSKEHIVKLL